MKIYFAGSIRGRRDDQKLYLSIINELAKFGTVLTEHVGSGLLKDTGESNISDVEIFDRDMDWIKEADVIVAEVTTPSLGVGYELGQAEAMNKPTICLYRKLENKRLSAMISGNSYFKKFTYEDITDISKILKEELVKFS